MHVYCLALGARPSPLDYMRATWSGGKGRRLFTTGPIGAMLTKRPRRNEYSDGEVTFIKKETAMGDRSPKSVQKQASQKQSRTNDSNQKKQQLLTAQQATKAKLAANKKK